MPDRKTFVNGPVADALQIAAFQAAMQSDLSSHARHALEGCLFGLVPNSAQTHVQPGEAYVPATGYGCALPRPSTWPASPDPPARWLPG